MRVAGCGDVDEGVEGVVGGYCAVPVEDPVYAVGGGEGGWHG